MVALHIEQARRAAFEVDDAITLRRKDLRACFLNMFLNVPTAMTAETPSWLRFRQR